MKDKNRKAMYAKKGYDSEGHLKSTGFDSKGVSLNADAQMARHKELMKEKEKEFLERKKNWTVEPEDFEGDGEGSIIFTNKKNPERTVELHEMDDDVDDDEEHQTEDGYTHYEAWYMFPALNGKGIPNSPNVVSETGGYKRADAIKELKTMLIEEDENLG